MHRDKMPWREHLRRTDLRKASHRSASEGRTGRAPSCLPGSPVPIIRAVMTPWSARQALILLLAVLVTLSMSLSLVQASTMSAMGDMTPRVSKMMMGGSGHNTCKDCTKTGDGAKVVTCGSGCVPPVIAPLAQIGAAAPLLAPIPPIKWHSLLHGRVPAPNPYPPRLDDLG
jgi:hypothetical protein